MGRCCAVWQPIRKLCALVVGGLAGLNARSRRRAPWAYRQSSGGDLAQRRNVPDIFAYGRRKHRARAARAAHLVSSSSGPGSRRRVKWGDAAGRPPAGDVSVVWCRTERRGLCAARTPFQPGAGRLRLTSISPAQRRRRWRLEEGPERDAAVARGRRDQPAGRRKGQRRGRPAVESQHRRRRQAASGEGRARGRPTPGRPTPALGSAPLYSERGAPQHLSLSLSRALSALSKKEEEGVRVDGSGHHEARLAEATRASRGRANEADVLVRWSLGRESDMCVFVCAGAMSFAKECAMPPNAWRREGSGRNHCVGRR